MLWTRVGGDVRGIKGVAFDVPLCATAGHTFYRNRNENKEEYLLLLNFVQNPKGTHKTRRQEKYLKHARNICSPVSCK